MSSAVFPRYSQRQKFLNSCISNSSGLFYIISGHMVTVGDTVDVACGVQVHSYPPELEVT